MELPADLHHRPPTLTRDSSPARNLRLFVLASASLSEELPTMGSGALVDLKPGEIKA